MDFDIRKQPLSKLTKDQIKVAYKVLQEIEDELNGKPCHGVSLLEELSSRFYTYHLFVDAILL